MSSQVLPSQNLTSDITLDTSICTVQVKEEHLQRKESASTIAIDYYSRLLNDTEPNFDTTKRRMRSLSMGYTAIRSIFGRNQIFHQD